jgi:hypothetical protein
MRGAAAGGASPRDAGTTGTAGAGAEHPAAGGATRPPTTRDVDVSVSGPQRLFPTLSRVTAQPNRKAIGIGVRLH